MHLQDEVKFTDEPCPECKKDGGPTGYLVKRDCEQCLGTGRKRDTE